MNQYILFCFMDYYPRGGLGDIQGSYDTLTEARENAMKKYWDTREVVNRDTWQVVWTGPP